MKAMSRIALRALEPGDDGQINPWLPEAAAAAQGSRQLDAALVIEQFVLQVDVAAEVLVVARVSSQEPCGLLVLSATDKVAPSPRIDFLAIAAGERNLGLGAEAAYAVERRVNRRPLFVRIPRNNGWAIYFWMRIGYRPWYPRSIDSATGDATWMVR